MKNFKQKFNGETIELSYNQNCFVPTATSSFLISAVSKNYNYIDSLLDLGCGIGVVGITLSKFIIINELYSSDLSIDAVNFCRLNSEKLKINNQVRQGALFEPWEGKKFDVIVNDISGISDKIASISPWFKFAPCDSGEDGLTLTNQIINQSKNYMSKNGKIVFPVISLSDTKKLLRHAESNFSSLKKLSSNSWFLPDFMSDSHNDLLNNLKNKGLIYYEEKFGRKICFTEIYEGKF